MNEIKNDIQKSRLRWDFEWEKREYLRKFYTQKWRENHQKKDPEPDGYTKLERYKNEREKLRGNTRKEEAGNRYGWRFL